MSHLSRCTALLAVALSLLPRAGAGISGVESVVIDGGSAQRHLDSHSWDINYLGLTTDLSYGSTEELVFEYEVQSDHNATILLLARNCRDEITGIEINATEPERTATEAGHDLLTVGYSLDKSMLARSSMYNSNSSTLEFCHVVHLTSPAVGDIPTLVIAEAKTTFDVKVGGYSNFGLSNKAQAGVPSGVADTETVDDYVEACKCEADGSFGCSDERLYPNDELHICVRSVSDGMQIDYLESMFVSQGETSLAFVQNDRVDFPSFTSREYVPGMNGVAVSTRVPSNIFSFGEGEFLSVTGVVVLKLPGPAGERERRRVLLGSGIEAGDGNIFDAGEDAPFRVRVGLGEDKKRMATKMTTTRVWRQASSAVAERGAAVGVRTLLIGMLAFGFAYS